MPGLLQVLPLILRPVPHDILDHIAFQESVIIGMDKLHSRDNHRQDT